MGAIITDAGRSLIAQLQAEQKILNINKFYYANIAGIDPSKTPPATEKLPDPENIVYTDDVTQSGYVGPDAVVYSNILGADTGNFSFNWIGLYCSEYSTLIAVTYCNETEKYKTDEFHSGNILSKNFGIQYANIKDISRIEISAETWQVDFSVRFKGIDERERLSNKDLYGEKYFFSDSFKFYRTTGYYLEPGTAYVDGIQIINSEKYSIGNPGALPKKIYADAWLDGDFHGMEAKWKIIISANEQSAYIDNANQQHYVQIIASIDANGTITDLRTAKNGKIPELEKNVVKLSDNPDLNDFRTGASTVATKILADRINTNTTNLSDHTENKSNPHGVTPDQLSVYTKTQIDTGWEIKQLINGTNSTAKDHGNGKFSVDVASAAPQYVFNTGTSFVAETNYNVKSDCIFYFCFYKSNQGTLFFTFNDLTMKQSTDDKHNSFISFYLKKGTTFRYTIDNGTAKVESTYALTWDNVKPLKNVYSYTKNLHNIYSGLFATGVFEPESYTEVEIIEEKAGYCRVYNETEKKWEYRTDPEPDYREFCKWVDKIGYQLDNEKKPKIIEEITVIVKDYTREAIEEKLLSLIDENEVIYTQDYEELRYEDWGEAGKYIKSLQEKDIQELINILKGAKK